MQKCLDAYEGSLEVKPFTNMNEDYEDDGEYYDESDREPKVAPFLIRFEEEKKTSKRKDKSPIPNSIYSQMNMSSPVNVKR